MSFAIIETSTAILFYLVVAAAVVYIVIKRLRELDKNAQQQLPSHLTTSKHETSQGPFYKVARKGVTIGTFDSYTFGKMVGAGVILPTDHFWKQGMNSWELVSNHPDR